METVYNEMRFVYRNSLCDCLDGRKTNARASCALDLQFKYQAGKILPTVVNSSPPFQHCLGAIDAEMVTANSLHASTEYGEYNERFGWLNHYVLISH